MSVRENLPQLEVELGKMSEAKKTVLVADDQAGGRELVRCVLEHCGYAVFEARDGAQAVRTAQMTLPDLILLNLHMPLLDGFEVLRELKADRRFVDTPIVALTGSAMKFDRERALAAGFTSYLAKPVSLSVLRIETGRLLSVYHNDTAWAAPSFSGHLTDLQGRAVSGAAISLLRRADASRRETKTDDQGRRLDQG